MQHHPPAVHFEERCRVIRSFYLAVPIVRQEPFYPGYPEVEQAICLDHIRKRKSSAAEPIIFRKRNIRPLSGHSQRGPEPVRKSEKRRRNQQQKNHQQNADPFNRALQPTSVPTLYLGAFFLHLPAARETRSYGLKDVRINIPQIKTSG